MLGARLRAFQCGSGLPDGKVAWRLCRLLIGKVACRCLCRAKAAYDGGLPIGKQAREEGKGMHIVEVYRGTMPYHYGPFKNRSEALCFAKREIAPLGYRWQVFVLYGPVL